MLTRRNLLSLLAASSLGACARKPAEKPATVKLDYATYNPVGLLLKAKGYLEEELGRA